MEKEKEILEEEYDFDLMKEVHTAREEMKEEEDELDKNIKENQEMWQKENKSYIDWFLSQFDFKKIIFLVVLNTILCYAFSSLFNHLEGSQPYSVMPGS